MKYITLLLLLSLLLMGCASTYEVRKCESGTCSYAKIKSFREFSDGLEIEYNGTERTFEFRANQVSTDVTPLEHAAADILRAVSLGTVNAAPSPPVKQ